MMIKKILYILLICTPIASAHAWSPYLSAGGSLGLSLNGDDARSGGFSGAAGVRYKLGSADMRTEFEYSNTIFRKTYHFDTANGPASHDYDLKTQIYLVNLFATPQIRLMSSRFHFGLSAGATTYKRDLPEILGGETGAKTTFIYGATAGLGLNLIAGLYADVGIRYLRTFDDDVVDNLSPYFKLRYGF